MSRTLAKTAQIMISATSAGAASNIDALASWDADFSCSEIDATGIYDANKQYLPGQGDAKGSLTLICDPDSTTQKTIIDAQTANTVVYLTVRLAGTGTGKEQIVIPVYITGYKISGSTDGRIELAMTWVAAGDKNTAAQA